MAFTAVAAVFTAEAVTATMVLAAVAEVGIAMTVVGAVTGSKDLMKIGGAMSLIGGVGGMIAGSMSTAAGTVAAEGIGEAATSAALDAASAEAAGAFGGSAAAEAATADLVAGMEGAAAGGADLATAATSAAPQGIVGATLNPAPAAAEAGLQMPVGQDAVPSMVKEVGAPAGVEAPAGAQGPATPFDNPTDMRLQAGTQAPPMNAPEGAKSFFGRFASFAEKNKTLFSAGMQLAGGAMKGASERDMWNQKMALDRQRLQQTSYGNQVARFQPRGIVEGAR